MYARTRGSHRGRPEIIFDKAYSQSCHKSYEGTAYAGYGDEDVKGVEIVCEVK